MGRTEKVGVEASPGSVDHEHIPYSRTHIPYSRHNESLVYLTPSPYFFTHLECCLDIACGQVPGLDDLVAAADDSAAIRSDSHRVDGRSVPLYV